MKVGLLYGGKSTEHEVSIRSAISVYDAIDHSKHDVTLIHINKDGNWLLSSEEELKTQATLDRAHDKVITIAPGSYLDGIGAKELHQLDVIFPVLHGNAGEDGTVQGLLEIADIPFVGCSLLSSAMCMDKDVTKKMLTIAGLNVAKGITVKRHELNDVDYEAIAQDLGFPLFIKPANQGSSVGVTRVDALDKFEASLKFAFRFDNKVLIERGVVGRELEVAVLGNEELVASVPGEVVANKEFYSYESKYIDETGATLSIPAVLECADESRIRHVALEAYRALECSGMARVDVFLTEDGEIVINEINTLPGFTSISMYPKLLEVTGIPYSELIDRLLDLALENYNKKKALVTDFEAL